MSKSWLMCEFKFEGSERTESAFVGSKRYYDLLNAFESRKEIHVTELGKKLRIKDCDRYFKVEK